MMTVIFAVIVWAINASGVSESAKAALRFLVIEVGVVLGLVGTILGHGGAEGLSFGPFNPTNSITGIGGLGTGMLWGILMFIGFESVSTLGEEAKSPKRNIPIALFSAVIVIGVFYVLTSYAAAVGFGQSGADAFAADQSPWTTLANKFWGASWALVLTVLASQFANFISGTNAVVRVIFSMGREGILPRILGRTSKRQVPQFALTCYLAFGLVFVLVLGSLTDPLTLYGFAGTILGLGMVVIYILLSISVIRFYRKEHPTEFGIWRHGIIPVATALMMLLPLWGQISPVPAFPNNLAPYIIAIWILIGVGYLMYLKRKKPELVTAMGRVFEEDPSPGESPDGSSAPEPSKATSAVSTTKPKASMEDGRQS
ncbi:APC family permease [Arthrobacter sp. NA-172]|uniref:APC family permease n=1 Tax=Arthrobacter sp. NA-172 TaxID=3367524 RepID=UPI0037548C4D